MIHVPQTYPQRDDLAGCDEREELEVAILLNSGERVASEPRPAHHSLISNLETPCTSDVPDRIGQIPLSQGYVARVSPEDHERVSAFKWCVLIKKGKPYARRTASPRYLHQFVAGGTWFDHADGDGLNCIRTNLRPCNKRQNAQNKARSSASRNPYKGIEPRGKRWRAYIYDDDHRIRLGTFDTPELAALAYDAKARELFGEFARLNFPEVAA